MHSRRDLHLSMNKADNTMDKLCANHATETEMNILKQINRRWWASFVVLLQQENNRHINWSRSGVVLVNTLCTNHYTSVSVTE